jgi:hypothetical protein
VRFALAVLLWHFISLHRSQHKYASRPIGTITECPRNTDGAIRNDKLEFDAFLVKWRNGLNDRGMEWEGRLAVAELKRNDAFEFLLGDGKWAHNRQTQHLFRKMFHEIKVYREEAQGRPTKQHIDEVENKLIAIAEKIQKEMDQESIPNLKRVYERVLVNIHGQRGRLHAIRILTPKKFGFWVEMIWRDLPSRNMVARTIELDTRLQVELGKVLIFYLREKKVSLLTIARLILLAYWAGDLSGLGEIPVKVSKKKGKKEGEEEGSEVNEVPQEVSQQEGREKKGTATSTPTVTATKASYTDRPLKVRNIHDNLREAGLHRAAAFDPKKADRLLMAEIKQARRILGRAGSGLGILPQLSLSKFVKARGLTQPQVAVLIRTLLTAQRATNSESDV